MTTEEQDARIGETVPAPPERATAPTAPADSWRDLHHANCELQFTGGTLCTCVYEDAADWIEAQPW